MKSTFLTLISCWKRKGELTCLLEGLNFEDNVNDKLLFSSRLIALYWGLFKLQGVFEAESNLDRGTKVSDMTWAMCSA